jgi:DNA polymerase-3 subunit alpha
MLFGKDYVNFSNYLTQGMFIFIRGKVQAKWNREDNLEFKPIQMELLNDVKEKRFKEVNVRLNLSEINEEMILDLHSVSQTHPGKFDLKLNVFDDEERIDLMLFSRNTKIEISREVQKRLAAIAGPRNVNFS